MVFRARRPFACYEMKWEAVRGEMVRNWPSAAAHGMPMHGAACRPCRAHLSGDPK